MEFTAKVCSLGNVFVDCIFDKFLKLLKTALLDGSVSGIRFI